MSGLTELAHDLVFSTDISARDLAKRIGKPYSTMMRELNPHDTGAKLGAETLLQIMLEAGKVAPLEYMAAKLGYKLTKID